MRLGIFLCVVATLLFGIVPTYARDGRVVLQFDDIDSTQFNPGFSIIQAHGLIASYGLITGEIGVRPGAMTDAMVIALRDYGCGFQDHTWNHWAGFWGNPYYADEWPGDIARSQAVFDRLGIPMTAWNQPGGTNQAFTPSLRDTLVAHGYLYAAGRVGLRWEQQFNFHYGYLDDPFSLGRGVYSWGYNAPSDGWTWQAEVAAIETKVADGVAQGRFPTPVFHIIDSDAASGLEAICDWIVERGIDAVTLDEAVALAQADNSVAYGMNLAPSLEIDRDGNGRPDGWLYVSMDGNAENGAETTIYGLPPGKLAVSAELIGPQTDEFTVMYEKTAIRMYPGPTYAYSTGQEYRKHWTSAGQPIAFADTVNVGYGTDRIRIQLYGFAQTPVQLLRLEAVPLLEPVSDVTELPPPANLRFHVWPNPSSGVVHLETDRPAMVEIFDVQGRRLGRVTTPDTKEIDLRSSGVYFLRATSGRTTATARAVITR